MNYTVSCFHLGKEGIILRECNGFIWLETLVAFSLVMLVATIIIPIYSTVLQEKTIIYERTIISLYLFEELQRFIYDESLNKNRSYQVNVANRRVTVTFKTENEFIKGCVSWRNVKERTEKRCLYGIPEI